MYDNLLEKVDRAAITDFRREARGQGDKGREIEDIIYIIIASSVFGDSCPWIPRLLFYGPSGTGKNSLVDLIVKCTGIQDIRFTEETLLTSDVDGKPFSMTAALTEDDNDPAIDGCIRNARRRLGVKNVLCFLNEVDFERLAKNSRLGSLKALTDQNPVRLDGTIIALANQHQEEEHRPCVPPAVHLLRNNGLDRRRASGRHTFRHSWQPGSYERCGRPPRRHG